MQIHAKRAGYTLLEMTVAVMVLGLVLGSVGVFQNMSNDQSQSLIERSQVESRAQRTLNRIVGELTGVAQSLLVPDPGSVLGSSTLTYQRAASVSANGSIVWEAPSTLRLEADPADPVNGEDDDGDGLADECRLVLQKVGTSATTVLCTNVSAMAGGETANGYDDDSDGIVDETGFHVQRTGDLLRVHLSVLEARGKGDPLRVDLEASVVLRN
jgi:prepilin-type N-terminal cleavage/methylation domain-containing protein